MGSLLKRTPVCQCGGAWQLLVSIAPACSCSVLLPPVRSSLAFQRQGCCAAELRHFHSPVCHCKHAGTSTKMSVTAAVPNMMQLQPYSESTAVYCATPKSCTTPRMQCLPLVHTRSNTSTFSTEKSRCAILATCIPCNAVARRGVTTKTTHNPCQHITLWDTLQPQFSPPYRWQCNESQQPQLVH